MSIMLLIAMLLHVAIAAWFSMPEPVPRIQPEKPLKVNLLAMVAESTVNAAVEKIKPPVVKKKPPKPEIRERKPVKKIPKPEPIVETPLPVVTPPPPIESVPTVPDAVSTARYEQLLLAWLEKYKRYPSRAKRMRIEGEAILRITIDRAGNTQQVSLHQRSGNRLLDKAALEMAQRASPFPPMPENDPRQQLEFVVPVAFLLR